MDISLKARVHLADGACGCLTHIIVDLLTQQATHLVVSTKGAHPIGRLVPVKWAARVTPDAIRLRSTQDDLYRVASFTVIDWNPPEPCHHAPLRDEYLFQKLLMRPYFNPVKRVRVSSGQLAICAGTRVTTSDGRAGRIAGLVVDSPHWRVTHLTLRIGPPWDIRQVTVPFAQVDCIGARTATPTPGVRSVEAIDSITVESGTGCIPAGRRRSI